ncbi:MAG TPA: FCD domain-containing protein [Stellaceae bacterium]|nr:FCD domain-containing protein [Stellaceae bacterium]
MRRSREHPDILRPVAPPRRLSHAIAERIAGEIAKGDLAPGARLPSEQAMGAAMGVSRTVVREAVAALRADGLVVTRQGAGAFVAEGAGRPPFRLAAEGLNTLEAVLDVMELRASVETAAAGLAAARGSAVARRRIRAALARIDAAIRRGENAVDQDFAFHRAIAAATGNPQFSRFLEYLGRFIIPRQSVRLAVHREGGQRAYLERIQDEHGAILVAIEAGAAEAAREAMRVHLANSQERYRRIAAEARAPGAVPPSLSTTPTGPAGRGRRG